MRAEIKASSSREHKLLQTLFWTKKGTPAYYVMGINEKFFVCLLEPNKLVIKCSIYSKINDISKGSD